MRKIARGKHGFTLVELMIVVAIVGVLAVLAIFGVRKYISNAKTAEARNALGQIAKSAAMAYDRELASGAILTAGSSTTFQRTLCDSATATVPSAIASVQNKKYQSTRADWNNAADSATKGWTCLKYSMEQPQYYMYGYTASNISATNASFTATANGDLDGNSSYSTFSIAGSLQNGQLSISPNISETDPEE